MLFGAKRRVVAAVTTVAVLAVVGGAFAYFTSSGSGTASGAVGNAFQWSVQVATATGGPLYPGSGSETIPYTIRNTDQGHQQLSSVTVAVASSGGYVTQGGAAVSGCSASWFTAVDNPPAPLPVDLPGGGAVSGSVTVTMQDTSVNQDACKKISPDIIVVGDHPTPVGGAVTVNGVAASAAGTSSQTDSSSFSVGSRTNYTEPGSGLSSSTLTVQSFATNGAVPGAGSCTTTPAGPFSTATTVSGTNQPGTVLAGYCYAYTLTGTDNVGNTASVKTTVQVAPKLWAQADSINQANGTSVTAWPDSSPLGNNLKTGATAPTLNTNAWNGHKAVAFNGSPADLASSQSMAAGNAPYDIFVVARPNSISVIGLEQCQHTCGDRAVEWPDCGGGRVRGCALVGREDGDHELPRKQVRRAVSLHGGLVVKNNKEDG